jgi:four helix bundle protein
MIFMFEDLTVYKKSMKFVEKVYSFCGSRSSSQNRKLIDQLQRAALSIPLNIAEGNGRVHEREKKQYFYTARGSLLECVPILRLCMTIDNLGKEQFIELYNLAEEIGKMLNGLIKSVGRTTQGKKEDDRE